MICSLCKMEKRIMLNCESCKKSICASCSKMENGKCADCVKIMFEVQYRNREVLYAGKMVLAVLLSIIFLIPFANADLVSSTNCSKYLLFDNAQLSIDCNAVTTNNTDLGTGGWSAPYGFHAFYYNAPSNAYEGGWYHQALGQDTADEYTLSNTNFTCSFWVNFGDESSYGSSSGSLFGVNSNIGFMAVGGYKESASTTKFSYNIGPGYTASSVNMLWNQWVNIKTYYFKNTNASVYVNDQLIAAGSAWNPSTQKVQMFYNFGASERARSDLVRCWNGSPSAEPMDFFSPSTPYPASLLSNVSATNDSIAITWSYNNQANGGVMILKNGNNFFNQTYPTGSYNITGLLNNTNYNITLLSYNSSGTNFTQTSGNSQIFKTKQYLYEPPPILANVYLTSPAYYILQRLNPLNFTFYEDFNSTGCYLYSNIGLGYTLRSSIITGLQNVTEYYNVSVPYHNLSNVLHWYKFEENIGSLIYDNMTTQNCSNVNNASYQASKGSNQTGSYSINFNGANQYINCNQSNNFERTDTFSFSAWFKTSTASGYFFDKSLNSATYTGYQIYLSSGKITVDLTFSYAALNYLRKQTVTTFNDNAWHNLIVTYDGSSVAGGVNIYVDGNLTSTSVLRDSLSLSILNSETFKIGSLNTGGTWFNGNIDEFFSFNKELPAAEVLRIYSDGLLRYNISQVENTSEVMTLLVINQSYNLSQTFDDDVYVNVSAFVDCNLSNGTQIRSNYLIFPYSNDFTWKNISLIYPGLGQIINVSRIYINFSVGEAEICSLNDTVWSLNYTNSTFYSFFEQTSTERSYSINITCFDPLNNTGSLILDFQKNLSYGLPPEYIPPEPGYNQSLIPSTMINTSLLRLDTIPGVLMLFLFFFITIAFIVFAEVLKTWSLMFIAGIILLIFAIVMYLILSWIIGVCVGIFAMMYIVSVLFRA